MSSTPQTPWFEPLEVAAVAGRAAEVDREPGVALVDEVLRVPVPLVAVAARSGRRAGRRSPAPALGRGAARAGTGTPGSRGRRTSGTSPPPARTCGAARDGDAAPARGATSASCRRDEPQLGRRGVVLVGARAARRRPSSAARPRRRPRRRLVTAPVATSTVTRSKRLRRPRTARDRVAVGLPARLAEVGVARR